MFSSDNGTTFDVGGVNAEYFNLTAGLQGRKQDLYEGGIREPFIYQDGRENSCRKSFLTMFLYNTI